MKLQLRPYRADDQRRSYESAYPEAEHQIIEQDGQSIGRIMLLREKDFTLLVDIALLVEHRKLGIGGTLIRELALQCHATVFPCAYRC